MLFFRHTVSHYLIKSRSCLTALAIALGSLPLKAVSFCFACSKYLPNLVLGKSLKHEGLDRWPQFGTDEIIFDQ